MEEFQIFPACKTAVIDPRIIMGEVEQNADSLELIYLRSAGKAPPVINTAVRPHVTCNPWKES